MHIKKEIADIFSDMNIEYFAALSYSDVVEARSHIIRKCDITPRSVILFLLPYYCGETVNISKYAAARDYHIAVKLFTDELINRLEKLFPDARFFGFGDHSPIDERDAALKASLGILGENGLLINEKYGSYIFIAEVITDIPPNILGAAEPSDIKRCSSCGRCLAACPTGALGKSSAPCLSAITQKKGSLTDGEIGLIKQNNTAWGCDICQNVCPYNKTAQKTPLEFFKENRIERLTKEVLLSLSDTEFSERAFSWRGRNTILRNLEILEEN